MSKRFLLAGLASVVVVMFLMAPFSAAETASVQTLYIIPFNQGVAPEAATTALFDGLVERLFVLGEQRGIQVTIVKQELTDADVDWFAGKLYLIGEITAYNEDKGCCYTELKLTAQTQLHRPGGEKLPIQELSDELFFNHDLSPLQQSQVELADRVGRQMADQLLTQIDPN